MPVNKEVVGADLALRIRKHSATDQEIRWLLVSPEIAMWIRDTLNEKITYFGRIFPEHSPVIRALKMTKHSLIFKLQNKAQRAIEDGLLDEVQFPWDRKG